MSDRSHAAGQAFIVAHVHAGRNVGIKLKNIAMNSAHVSRSWRY